MTTSVKDPNSRSWIWKRNYVFRRDNGSCQVCARTDLSLPGMYECGHIIDRACGGTDDVENLVAMCVVCNQMKPIHETEQAYREWVDRGGYFGELEIKMGDFIRTYFELFKVREYIRENYEIHRNDTDEVIDKRLLRIGMWHYKNDAYHRFREKNDNYRERHWEPFLCGCMDGAS